MKVFDGFRLSADGELSSADVYLAKKFAVDTRLEAHARGLFHHAKRFELAGGGYAQVVKAGDFLHVHMHLVGGDKPDTKQIELFVPDFGSGLVSFNEAAAYSAYNQYNPTAFAAERLSITDTVQDLPRYAVSIIPRENLHKRPMPRASMYSGKIRELVQYFLGIGKPPRVPNAFSEILPIRSYEEDDKPPEQENADVKDAFDVGINVYRIRYNADRTHGLAKATDGSWWIVEVGSWGLLVMPLRFYPGTQSPGFKTKASEIDPEVAKVIETFGGLPSHASVPSMSFANNVYIRAGLVQKIANYTPVGSANYGWSFDYDGTEARNCLKSTNWQHWRAYWTINGLKTPISDPSAPPLYARLYAGGTGWSATYQEVVRGKVAYMTAAQIATAMGQATPEATFEWVDTLQITRVDAEGGFTLVESGPIPYWEHTPPVTRYSIDGDEFFWDASASVNPGAGSPPAPVYVYHNHNTPYVVYVTTGYQADTNQLYTNPGYEAYNPSRTRDFAGGGPSLWVVGDYIWNRTGTAVHSKSRAYIGGIGNPTPPLFNFDYYTKYTNTPVTGPEVWATGGNINSVQPFKRTYVVSALYYRHDKHWVTGGPNSIVIIPGGIRSGCMVAEITTNGEQTYTEGPWDFYHRPTAAYGSLIWNNSWNNDVVCPGTSVYPHLWDDAPEDQPNLPAALLPYKGPYDFTIFSVTYGWCGLIDDVQASEPPMPPGGLPGGTYSGVYENSTSTITVKAHYDELGPTPVTLHTMTGWSYDMAIGSGGAYNVGIGTTNYAWRFLTGRNYYTQQYVNGGANWNLYNPKKQLWGTANSFGANNTFVMDVLREVIPGYGSAWPTWTTSVQYVRAPVIPPDPRILDHHAVFVGVVEGEV